MPAESRLKLLDIQNRVIDDSFTQCSQDWVTVHLASSRNGWVGLPEPSAGDGQDVAERAETQPQFVTHPILPVEPILGGEDLAQRPDSDAPPSGYVQNRERIVGTE